MVMSPMKVLPTGCQYRSLTYNRIDMSKERLQEIAKELANNANMPYCWEDVYNRLIGGYPLPFKVVVK